MKRLFEIDTPREFIQDDDCSSKEANSEVPTVKTTVADSPGFRFLVFIKAFTSFRVYWHACGRELKHTVEQLFPEYFPVFLTVTVTTYLSLSSLIRGFS